MGGVLFFYVWWPIQAERALITLKRVEKEVSQKKQEINELNSKYASLTSLSNLDAWAKKNGPWKSPSANDIFTIEY